MMWTLLGAINGGVLLALILAALLLASAWCLGPAKRNTAYNPTVEGTSTVPRTVAKLRPFPCEVAGCQGMRSARHLVCPACWKRVPKHLRADVYRQWDAFQGRQPGGYLRWMAARQKCLESLQ
ncbi:hypothetical protein [Kribbella sp. NBC_00889]|uniref:hypothetical protein n=1 Tax=Kribbella sp. NBC_00889 TaxID=2975974 RepID=UPI00386D3D2E|nr:hypothetical protein OG817_22085 [Kribbella sp. NBC_00889]